MTEQEKIEFAISPEKYLPFDINPGEFRGSGRFIRPFVAYVNILHELQYWPVDLLEHIRLERLKRLVSKVATHSSFWSDYFEKYDFRAHNIYSLKDLYHLPILDRGQLSHWSEHMHVPLDGQLIRRSFTSGTSGRQVVFKQCQRERIYTDLACLLRHPAFESVHLGELLQRKFVVMLGNPGWRGSLLTDFVYAHLPQITPVDLEDALVEDICQRLFEAKPAYLVGFASLVLEFARKAEIHNIASSILAAGVASEPISLDDRTFVERTLGASVVNIPAATGIEGLGFECMENMGNYHLYLDRVIAHVVNEKGEALGIGEEGELVVTVLNNFATPFIRYATGDLGALVPSECPCGRTLPLFQFKGRRGEVLRRADGGKIPAVSLYNNLASNGAMHKTIQIQVRQQALDRLKVLLIPRKNFTSNDEIKLRLAITRLFGNEKVIVDVSYVDKIAPTPGGKSRFFVPLELESAVP